MALTFKQTKHSQTWQSLLLEESEKSLLQREAVREWTFRRMYLSVFILVSTGFILYCSLFYVGAFVDVGKIVGTSQSVRAHNAQQNISTMPLTKKRTIFSPIAEDFSINRIYMRKGQSILATYSLPKNANLSLIIKQCKSQPLLEVFTCKVMGEQNSEIRNHSKGFVEFTVSEPGFYYFDDKVFISPNINLKAYHDYRIVWQRGGKQAQKTRLLSKLR